MPRRAGPREASCWPEGTLGCLSVPVNKQKQGGILLINNTSGPLEPLNHLRRVWWPAWRSVMMLAAEVFYWWITYC